MRLDQNTDGRSHDALTDVSADQHHSAPDDVTFSDTSTVISAGSAFNLDVTLPNSGFVAARVYMEGPAIAGGGSGSLWRECATVHVTTDTADAIGHSVRNTGSIYKSYVVTYAKQLAVTNLTHKIFDTVTAPGSRYIALKDAQIIGSTLRLTFHNYDSSSRTLSVKGQAVLY